MSQIDLSQEIIQALLLLEPRLAVMSDKTIASVAKGNRVSVPSSEFEMSLDAQEVIDLSIKYLPVVASSLSIIKNAYDFYKFKIESDAVDEIYRLSKQNNPDLYSDFSADSARAAIRASLLVALNSAKSKTSA